MRRLLPLLGTMMLAVMLWTGTVARAADIIGCVESAGHVDGDRDEAPSDGDKGLPHAHGVCHGHLVAVPETMTAAAAGPSANAPANLFLQARLSGAGPGTALRPPIA